jgi:signal transduction histidine kinase
MGRHLLAAVVVLLDTLLFAGVGRSPVWLVLAYGLAAVLVVLSRYPAAGFVGALVLGVLSGGSYVLLLWAAYRAGRTVAGRTETAVIVGAALGGLGITFATGPMEGQVAPQTFAVYAVFVALPLLAGRFVTQQEQQRDLVARQERLAERLRIARDMHDSLGRRLSLVSVQAAALEVGDLPSPQRESVAQLAQGARSAMEELYGVLGALRGETVPVDGLVAEFRAAGVRVELQTRGAARPLDEAAYRVVEEGLTNAAKHAPGQPVTVHISWERDAVLVSVVNAVSGGGSGRGAGKGLAGLAERISAAGGSVDHAVHDGQFRLAATLPSGVAPSRAPAVTVGIAVALLMFLVLPASMLVGIG